jgi:hypothetical protein
MACPPPSTISLRSHSEILPGLLVHRQSVETFCHATAPSPYSRRQVLTRKYAAFGGI